MRRALYERIGVSFELPTVYLRRRTPVQNAMDAGRSLPRSQTLVVEGASHALFREAEVNRAMVTYFGRSERNNRGGDHVDFDAPSTSPR